MPFVYYSQSVIIPSYAEYIPFSVYLHKCGLFRLQFRTIGGKKLCFNILPTIDQISSFQCTWLLVFQTNSG